MDQRLSLLTLGVHDVSTSRAFYQRLGWWPSSIGGDDVAFFQAGGIVIALWNREQLAADAGIKSDAGGFAGVAMAYNVHQHDDVDRILAEAVKAGGTLLKPAEEKSWGGYGGYFADPDGHPWEVAWNPGFKLCEDGSLIVPE